MFLQRLSPLLHLGVSAASLAGIRTYTNPILPGWHSDPSCVYVAEQETFFCATSTFIAFPGLPVYASKDLGGIYAPTLRYRDGTFHLIVSFLGPDVKGLVSTSDNPYDGNSWSEPLVFPVHGIDPDIFWDEGEDGQVYVTSADNNQIQHYTLDLSTGEIGPVTYLWNGTGGAYPEGPHLFKKDGIGLDPGALPYNPILTNRKTTQYFQTVGHADLFQDGDGHWWGVALSTRSGPDWVNYPMGRETVLTSGTWEDADWPVLEPVRGYMKGPLPPKRGVKDPINRPEHLTFAPGSAAPEHLMYWRFPEESSYVVSPRNHPHTLRLTPSAYGPSYNPAAVTDPITFIARRQTDTLFSFSVDLDFSPTSPGVEAGISVFLTQEQHVDLSVVDIARSTPRPTRVLQLNTYGRGNYNGSLSNITMDVPMQWIDQKLTLSVEAVDDATYEFSASLASRPRKNVYVGSTDARVLSGDTGRFTGTLVGVYASRAGHRGGNGTDFAYFSNWKYAGLGQKVDYDVIVPSY
ncbi:glycosyl hydrolase [Aspergillus desertorum]